MGNRKQGSNWANSSKDLLNYSHNNDDDDTISDISYEELEEWCPDDNLLESDEESSTTPSFKEIITVEDLVKVLIVDELKKKDETFKEQMRETEKRIHAQSLTIQALNKKIKEDGKILQRNLDEFISTLVNDLETQPHETICDKNQIR